MSLNKVADHIAIALKCEGLGFPVSYQRSEDGPRVTTHFYTQQFGSNSPLSKILNRANDIAFACKVDTVMITRVKNEIAIQVPREDAEIIKFDSCIHNLLMNSVLTQRLPLVMGQTPTGINFTVDLADQPHILIAGSTGSGKSVFQSQLISGLVLARSPAQLELYLVDTKQLDLTLFRGLAHVRSIVDKVERVHDLIDNLILNVRRRTAAMTGIARNIEEFNEKQIAPPLKYKVMVIDELADVISQDAELAKKELVEIEIGTRSEKRTRLIHKVQTLTQISRAAGIHVIAATQRPSVKLMSGDIKANFPMRVAFRLPTSADSRVILGEGGAENLLERGDYLYQSATMSDPVRGHGAFISINEIKALIETNETQRETYEMLRAGLTTQFNSNPDSNEGGNDNGSATGGRPN